MKKNLTLRYTVQQCAYWAAAAGVVSFATAFLLEKGFAASHIGILLASGNLLSCVAQPMLAGMADRIGRNIVKWFILGLTTVSMVCFGGIRLLNAQGPLYGLIYLLGVFALDAMNPLLNAVSVSYNQQGFRINYGVGRGIGSFAYAVSALVIGKVMAAWGADWMIYIALGLLAVNVAVTLGYPALPESGVRQATASQCCSVPVFFRRYKWYCVSLLGVMSLAMFHSMTENYLIEIVSPLGGDSGTVGIALFVATAIEMVVIVNFDWLRTRISDNWLLRLAGLSFLLKSVLFLMAKNVIAVYGIQLLQATSYSFLSPTQLYYAEAKVNPADMVKGQAFITAAYTLGCAIGNFTGGQLLDAFDVRTLLWAGVAMATAGTAVFFLTVDKKDKI
ncbi:MAG: MFS transporter [Oscillospiraceae bacterium]|nr:MFS transporter [Oscillospiraceae bacterium]MBQ7130325.1 MFS transporter [Oscillospiraceae bacterium]